MKALLLAYVIADLTTHVAAHLVSSYFPGYGFSWYDPICGFACQSAVSSAMLSCSSMDDMEGMSGMEGMTSPQCYATDTAFLTTVAFCMNSTCNPVDVPTWKREQFWATKLTGDETLTPKWDYSTTLMEIPNKPTMKYNSSSKDTLNQTVIIPADTIADQSGFMAVFDRLEMLQARYCIVLVTIGFGTPILITLLTKLPYMTRLSDIIKPYLIYPSLIGTYHNRPLPFLFGNAPTLGQALYISMFIILNVILTSVNYASWQPHPWGFAPREEMLSYIGYRTGHISFALLPLTILFAGRNNFLLWVTNWSHATYLLLHRWVARLCALHAIIHSITLLLTYQGTGTYATDSVMPFWQWGIVATVLACAMLVFSHLYFRKLAYEVFLALHVVMAVFVVAGCWYHVMLKFGMGCFYLNWLYAACAVWFFDRVVRVVRVAKTGLRHAVVTPLGTDHVRVDVPGVRWPVGPGKMAYAYFPTVNTWRPWENHPFSVNETLAFGARSQLEDGQSCSEEEGRGSEKEVGKEIGGVSAVVKGVKASTSTAGVTLIIKRNTGLTKKLVEGGRVLTLLDGPYARGSEAVGGVLACDRVVLLGGGIGITGLVAWVRAHRNVRLAWSIKTSHTSLVDEMKGVLAEVADKEVVVGGRLDVGAILKTEADAGFKKVGVVVCGPGGMCDNVRAVVAGLGRGSSSTAFELEVEAFSW